MGQGRATPKEYKIMGYTQGTTYSVTYYHTGEVISKVELDSVLSSIDLSMSLYQEGTLINSFNDPQIDYIIMDKYMKDVVEKSFEVHDLSKGIFDITVQPLTSIWGFSSKKTVDPPTKQDVDSALLLVGMDKLSLTGDTLRKKINGIKMDLDGIAQGYSVDVLSTYLRSAHISTFIVEIGGEIYTEGVKPNGDKMRVAVLRSQPDQNPIIIELQNKAITTSGTYERYKEYKGRNISHHIDPRTGYPVDTKIISATVIASSALEADALDNIFMYLEPNEALDFVSSIENVDLFLIYEQDGLIKELYSSGFKKYILQTEIENEKI